MRTLPKVAFGLPAAAIVIILIGCNSSGGGPGIAPATQTASSRILPDAKMNRPAELFNQILPYPVPCQNGSGPCPTDFEVFFAGNVTQDIPPSEPLNVHENAFCNPSSSPPDCSPSITYDPSHDWTVVEWSGSTLYHNRVSGAPGVHFGIMAAQNYKTNVKKLELNSEWTYSSSYTNPQPIVSINSKQPAYSTSWKYAVVYLAGTTTKGSTASDYATWSEIAYAPPPILTSYQQPQFTFTNYGTKPIYVQSSGIVYDLAVPTDPECQKTPACPENVELLGELQEEGYPPPGSKSSPFVPLQYPPAAVLKPKPFN
jgi:hypothetical protein